MKSSTMGAVIAARRRELGLTQLELAERMGVTDKAVSKWERDLSCPDVGSLPKLAQTLDLSVEELIQARTEPEKRGQPARKIVSLALRAVCLAMGVSTVVLSALGQLDPHSAILMLGIGVACAGASLLETE